MRSSKYHLVLWVGTSVLKALAAYLLREEPVAAQPYTAEQMVRAPPSWQDPSCPTACRLAGLTAAWTAFMLGGRGKLTSGKGEWNQDCRHCSRTPCGNLCSPILGCETKRFFFFCEYLFSSRDCYRPASSLAYSVLQCSGRDSRILVIADGQGCKSAAGDIGKVATALPG